MVDTVNARDARGDTRGHNYVVKLGLELVDVGTRVQVNRNFEHLQATGEVLQRLAVVLLARNLCGEVELATNLVGGLEDLRVVTPLSCGFRESESSHTSADDGDALGLVLRHRHGYQLGFVSRLRVDQTGRALGREGVVQAGLVTGDTGVDLVSSTIARLDGEVRVSQQRAGHGNQVRIAVSEDLLRNLGAIDSVGGCHRDVDKRTETTRQIRECGARHGRDDGGDASFVPADTGVEDIDASFDQTLRELGGLGPGLTVFHQVKQRNAVLQQEVIAHLGANATDNFDGQAHASLGAAAPVVRAVVGALGQELIEQVTLGAHNLDAVVTSTFRELRSADIGADSARDIKAGEAVSLKRANRRLTGIGGARQRAVAVTTGVQHLQHDVAAVGVHEVSNAAVIIRHALRRHH